MTVTIGPLTQQDYPQWAAIWRQYLTDTANTTLPESQFPSTFARLLAADGDIYCLVVRNASTSELYGLAHFTEMPSPWSEKGICFLSDLFVTENERNKGYGRMLMDAVAETAKRMGCRRVSWITETDNVAARRLYDKVATCEHVYYRWGLEA